VRSLARASPRAPQHRVHTTCDHIYIRCYRYITAAAAATTTTTTTTTTIIIIIMSSIIACTHASQSRIPEAVSEALQDVEAPPVIVGRGRVVVARVVKPTEKHPYRDAAETGAVTVEGTAAVYASVHWRTVSVMCKVHVAKQNRA
jgi:hypothetical protein